MTSTAAQFRRLMDRVVDFKKNAQWESAEQHLRDAWTLCSDPDYPNAARDQLKVQMELAEVTRRHGNYKDAIKAQQKVIKSSEIDDLRKCQVFGELGVNYRHSDRIEEAANVFQQHYDFANRISFEMEAEKCRAVGNLAMSKYQLYQKTPEQAPQSMILDSIRLQQERVISARDLQVRLKDEFGGIENNESQLAAVGVTPAWVKLWMARLPMWGAIGLTRLSLAYLANNDVDGALLLGKQGVEETKDATWADPTVRAISRFIYGHALLSYGNQDEARKHFDFPNSVSSDIKGVCTPAIALCKEPTEEHRAWLREMVRCGVDLTSYDEQGYSALDYAVYCNDTETTRLLEKGLAMQLDSEEQAKATKLALVRKHFRHIFHTHFRPILQRESADCIHDLRDKYVELLRNEREKRKRFDVLRLISIRDFEEANEIPQWGMDDTRTKTFVQVKSESTDEPFVVFFSYRWMGKEHDPSSRNPDSPQRFQYKRMLDALKKLLNKNPNIKKENVYIWLVRLTYCSIFYNTKTNSLSFDRTAHVSIKKILRPKGKRGVSTRCPSLWHNAT